MKRKTRIIIYLIVFLLSFIVVGYSYLNQTLSVDGQISVDPTSSKSKLAYDIVKSQSLGSSSTINYNVSSEYAEENYTDSSGYAHTAGVYQLQEDNNVYFYRGSVTNNNVLFANYCWKIVRTTTTGGVKLIYNGTPTDGQCTNTTGESTTIGTSAFNTSYNDAKYVGYTYTSSSKQVNSTIKTFVDNWYSTNMTSYTSYLEDTDYCNDRKTVSNSSSLYTNMYLDDWSNASSATFYGSYARSGRRAINVIPTTICSQNSDKYTVDSSNGNGYLTYPVGLLTSDEMALAGETSIIVSSEKKNSTLYTNTTYYIYNNYKYWSMSPSYFTSYYARVEYIRPTSESTVNYVNAVFGVRPVVSLASTIKFKAFTDGTTTNPYVVKEIS